MKKVLWAIALLSTVLVACSTNSSEPTRQGMESPSEMAKDKGDMDHSNMSDGVVAQASKDIHLVKPENSEVPMGDVELVVHVDKDNLQPEDIAVEVSMPMAGEEDMTALAIVEPGDAAQEFKIKTNFGMAGPWSVKVGAKDAEPTILAFTVK